MRGLGEEMGDVWWLGAVEGGSDFCDDGSEECRVVKEVGQDPKAEFVGVGVYSRLGWLVFAIYGCYGMNSRKFC